MNIYCIFLPLWYITLVSLFWKVAQSEWKCFDSQIKHNIMTLSHVTFAYQLCSLSLKNTYVLNVRVKNLRVFVFKLWYVAKLSWSGMELAVNLLVDWWLPTFRDKLSFPYSRVKQEDCFTLEDGADRVFPKLGWLYYKSRLWCNISEERRSYEDLVCQTLHSQVLEYKLVKPYINDWRPFQYGKSEFGGLRELGRRYRGKVRCYTLERKQSKIQEATRAKLLAWFMAALIVRPCRSPVRVASLVQVKRLAAPSQVPTSLATRGKCGATR